MKNSLIIALLIGVVSTGFAQDRMWVFFEDKGENTTEMLTHPEMFLSQDAIDRKNENGISIDQHDLPVHKAYVELMKTHSIKVLSSSKWLNAVAVELPESCREEVLELAFVKGIQPVRTLVQARARIEDTDEVPPARTYPRYVDADLPMDYGDAEPQNVMLNIHKLHAKGFTGKGVKIALFDSGFDAVDTIDVFKPLWKNNQIQAYWDFVDNDESVFREDSHGTHVMSTIGANQPGVMVGMAPDATFILCRTEDARSETQQEEHNWMRAVEWVDSIGVDVIHSSLGYSQFDDDLGSYTYENMDGNTAIITRAADIAAAKGIIVTTSAGNEGSGSWKYITAPCDADSVLCVGSVTKMGKHSSFSSYGPASDGRVKPDVMAMGSRTVIAKPRNYVASGDGTSYSGPLIGGFVACLRQAHPKRTNIDIVQAVRLSCDQYSTPDASYGFGIPNAVIADSLLTHVDDMSMVKMDTGEKPLRGKPAPPKVEKPIVFASSPQSKMNVVKDVLNVSTTSDIKNLQIMRGKQKVLLNPKDVTVNENTGIFKIGYLLPGDYYIHVKTKTYEENIKFAR